MNTPNTSPTSLQQSLTQLHAQLSATAQMDASSRQLLREVLRDIERVLASEPAKAASAGRQGARSRLEELAVRFDVGHPTLSASIREFVDLLGRAGL